MKVLSVAFSIEGDTRIMKGDALEHEGRFGSSYSGWEIRLKDPQSRGA